MATSGKTSKTSRGTDWKRLRRLTDAEIRKGIGGDPDVHPTNEGFSKKAKVYRRQSRARAQSV